MTENTSAKFEEERDIWQEVLDGVRQIKRGQYGRKFTVTPHRLYRIGNRDDADRAALRKS